MPFACPNSAETRDTDRMPGTRHTATDQESRRWLLTMKRPPKQSVAKVSRQWADHQY